MNRMWNFPKWKSVDNNLLLTQASRDFFSCFPKDFFSFFPPRWFSLCSLLKVRRTCSCVIKWSFYLIELQSHESRREFQRGQNHSRVLVLFCFLSKSITGRLSVYLILPTRRRRCLCEISNSCCQISAASRCGWKDGLLLQTHCGREISIVSERRSSPLFLISASCWPTSLLTSRPP